MRTGDTANPSVAQAYQVLSRQSGTSLVVRDHRIERIFGNLPINQDHWQLIWKPGRQALAMFFFRIHDNAIDLLGEEQIDV